MKRLKLSKDRKLVGVCAGIAEYFGVDPTLVRIIWIIFALSGIGVLAYAVCWALMPSADKVQD